MIYGDKGWNFVELDEFSKPLIENDVLELNGEKSCGHECVVNEAAFLGLVNGFFCFKAPRLWKKVNMLQPYGWWHSCSLIGVKGEKAIFFFFLRQCSAIYFSRKLI